MVPEILVLSYAPDKNTVYGPPDGPTDRPTSAKQYTPASLKGGIIRDTIICSSRKNVVKGEIAHSEQFLLLSTMFSKAVCCGCIKRSIYGVYLGFYAISTAFQLFNSDSSQIYVS